MTTSSPTASIRRSRFSESILIASLILTLTCLVLSIVFSHNGNVSETISKLFLTSNLENLSNDEISFYFVIGMSLHKEFKKVKIEDKIIENSESEIV